MLYFLFFCIPLCIGVGGILYLIKELYKIQTQNKLVPTVDITQTEAAPQVPMHLINDIEFLPKTKKEDIVFWSTLSIKNEYVPADPLLAPDVENTLAHNNVEKAYSSKHFIDEKGNTVEFSEYISLMSKIFPLIKAHKLRSDTIRELPVTHEQFKDIHLKHISDNEVIANGTEF